MTELSEQVIAELFGRRHKRPGDVLLRALKDDGHIVAPGVYNAFGAYAAREIYLAHEADDKKCDFNAVYLGGWAISAMLWRRPDMGFHDRTLMSLIGRHVIEQAHPLPVIMDAETGFGQETVTIAETVRAYHDIGVALGHLEDQGTRRCGNLEGKTCIACEAMEAKILAWLIASEELDTSMQLMVRTDAVTAAGGGIEDAIERMKRYMSVEYKGRRPLVSWADALIDPNDLEKWARELLAFDPKMVLGINYSPNKDWAGYYRERYDREPPTYDDLGEMGFSVIWHTILQARADMEATWNTIEQMANEGANVLWDLHERQRNHVVGNAQAMSGADEWMAFDRFIGGEEAAKRYRDSSGYGAEEE